jgi:hypothetical protein
MTTNEKIVEVARKINNDIGNVTDVVCSSGEYYFKYREQAFSIVQRSGPTNFAFFVYPHWHGEIKYLAALFEDPGMPADAAAYSAFNSIDISPEAEKAFDQLYLSIDRKYKGIDDLLDSILNLPS